MNIVVAIAFLAVVFFIFLLFTQPRTAGEILMNITRGLVTIFRFLAKILYFILLAMFRFFQAIFGWFGRLFKK